MDRFQGLLVGSLELRIGDWSIVGGSQPHDPGLSVAQYGSMGTDLTSIVSLSLRSNTGTFRLGRGPRSITASSLLSAQ